MAETTATREPQPGDHYIKDGREFTVHGCCNGEVYGVTYRLPAPSDDEIRASVERGELPQNLAGARRIDMADFLREIEGAEFVPVAREGGTLTNLKARIKNTLSTDLDGTPIIIWRVADAQALVDEIEKLRALLADLQAVVGEEDYQRIQEALS